ncbi:MAG: 10 kDa chaperonin [Parcubacteria group bacterium GW2011_GWB1_46_8]|nr:MAG: 10 kDa chaperonin [Parcubacteria group bacterium GW2011_GWF1_45_5]KKU43374.1 MAG: 10 kDa chaperonin [Parcubacteria group bacterium GW2011_GWA2_46_7]KKU45975.1 MAG: 10 kDa chaperonin [Parcubacteria group bacterium GW2011_GWB1_46_8]
MNIKPLSDYVLIEPIKEEKTTKTGIVIPDTAEGEKPQKGKIVAIGGGKLNDEGERIAMSVKVGDMVLFKKYGPDEIKVENEKGEQIEYLIGREEDILAIIE